MPGTSKGVKNSWATRREKYGPSGRASKRVDESSTNKNHRKPESSRNKSKAQRQPLASIPRTPRYEYLLRSRDDLIKAMDSYQKSKAAGKKAPASYIDDINRANYQRQARAFRQVDEEIQDYEKRMLAQERKKHGYRYGNQNREH